MTVPAVPSANRSPRLTRSGGGIRAGSLRFRLAKSLCRIGYAVGVLSGWGISMGGGEPPQIVGVMFTGHKLASGRRTRPNYVLGVSWEDWRCVLRFHHWPSPDKTGFGFCAKCCPCPVCDLPAPLEHECTEPTHDDTEVPHGG